MEKILKAISEQIDYFNAVTNNLLDDDMKQDTLDDLLVDLGNLHSESVFLGEGMFAESASGAVFYWIPVGDRDITINLIFPVHKDKIDSGSFVALKTLIPKRDFVIYGEEFLSWQGLNKKNINCGRNCYV